ncbi:50S ribosomal protein L18 [candidate division BRC1 bacterium SM23_51]|nr:MAG: 50S ribosomal protein L18 [candidate division BRC1 bacterium SM23_51]
MTVDRKQRLRRRHLRVRKKVRGTAERPRLCIHKSSRHLYAQLVDDDAQRTLLFVTTNRKAIKEGSKKKSFCNVEGAKRLGKEIGEQAVEAGMRKVVFDRGGYRYHGCVRSFAETAREAGLEF